MMPLDRMRVRPILVLVAEEDINPNVAHFVESSQGKLFVEEFADLGRVFEQFAGPPVCRHPALDVRPAHTRREPMSSRAADLGTPHARSALDPSWIELPLTATAPGRERSRLGSTFGVELRCDPSSRQRRRTDGIARASCILTAV